MKRFLPLLALLSAPAFAQDAAPAAAAPVPEASTNAVPVVHSRPQPGPLPRGRELSPEMRAYAERLEAIRVARDEQARAAAQAGKDIEARKATLAGENEDVKALVDKIAELRDALDAAETALEELYAADEALASLETKKADAEKARDAKQRELHAAVAAAMDQRAARFRVPPPEPGEESAAPAPAEAPAPAPAAE